MNVWLQGETLFHTLLVNTSFFGDSSLPSWEMEDPHVNRDKSEQHGVVDILTWQSRLIKLIANEGKVESMFFTQGRLTNKEDAKDPMKVYIKTKEGYSPLSLKESKAVWRDYHTIFMARNPESGEKRPECFNLVSRAIDNGVIAESESFVTHVSGLATVEGKAGKFVLWRHERLPLPVVLMKPDFLEVLCSMLKKAETAAKGLRERMRGILTSYLEYEKGPANWEELNDLLRSLDPLPQYWARLEPGFYDLLRALPQDWDYLYGGWKDEKDLKAGRAWLERIKTEAQRAIEDSVRMLGNTARAIRAIEKVGTSFTDKDLGIG
jgi:CRISPR system Cascade subunit CasA